jgi:hypothetical protein
MFNNLKEGKFYWIKHKQIRSRCEGVVSKSISDKMEVSLVMINHLDEEANAYFCTPIGRDVMYGISIEDILDVSLVENPFKDAREVN